MALRESYDPLSVSLFFVLQISENRHSWCCIYIFFIPVNRATAQGEENWSVLCWSNDSGWCLELFVDCISDCMMYVVFVLHSAQYYSNIESKIVSIAKFARMSCPLQV